MVRQDKWGEPSWDAKDIVLAKTNIYDIAKDIVELEPKETGSFTHRGYCPLHEGKYGGRERTPSFYISNNTNSFCCFGCGRAGNTIDLISQCYGIPFLEALKKLAIEAKLLDNDGNWNELELEVRPVAFDYTKTVGYYLLKISKVLREHIQQNKNDKELKWMEKVANKADGYLFNIDYDDWEFAREIFLSVEKAVEKRRKREK